MALECQPILDTPENVQRDDPSALNSCWSIKGNTGLYLSKNALTDSITDSPSVGQTEER
jgi:hypothetical protein